MEYYFVNGDPSSSLSYGSSSYMAINNNTITRRSNSNNNNKVKKIKGGCYSSSSSSKKSKGVMKLSTDPQSVAARERRHRISDKFKILQSLIPGGTKLDTASMLEEAINYVKFLKTQIWLHENMINFVDDHDPPNSYLQAHGTYSTQDQETTADHLYNPSAAIMDVSMQPISTPVVPDIWFHVQSADTTMPFDMHNFY